MVANRAAVVCRCVDWRHLKNESRWRPWRTAGNRIKFKSILKVNSQQSNLLESFGRVWVPLGGACMPAFLIKKFPDMKITGINKSLHRGGLAKTVVTAICNHHSRCRLGDNLILQSFVDFRVLPAHFQKNLDYLV
jgi:hypothetical protein